MDILVDESGIRIERCELGEWATNAYIVSCLNTGACAFIDAPQGAATLIDHLEGRPPAYILLTHAHFDHIQGLNALKSATRAPIAVHPADTGWLPTPPDMYLDDRTIITLGNLKLEVIYTPGHTPGSVCFRLGKHLISGDTIFPGGPGRTSSKDDFQLILKSLTGKIMVLPDDTLIYPGHGMTTVLHKEKAQFAAFASRPDTSDLYGDVTWDQVQA